MPATSASSETCLCPLLQLVDVSCKLHPVSACCVAEASAVFFHISFLKILEYMFVFFLLYVDVILKSEQLMSLTLRL